ncbi:ergosterol biosynthesis protein [Candidatus Poriferisodalis sp.]|uniref:ergosterol biosynthesis protein n=1 Tax=Candidatus Poriferisodalis sp. TaxID=3101277 RepID=UPI003B59FD4D
MFERLGIGHLVELPASQALLGFLTPLFVFAAFFVLQMVLPGRHVPGYVVDRETGLPCSYRLNGLLVFVVAQVLWWFELTGMPRDWFYRSSLYAVVGGTVLALILTLIAVFSQPPGEVKNKFLACWFGRAQEMQFFNDRFDLKMYFYVVGGTMLSLNAFSGAVWHYGNVEDLNPGVFVFAAFFTFYVFDYFVFERVQLYTYDVIYERLGFKMFWGGLIVYGWIFIIPMWGMAAHPDPGHGAGWRYLWLIGTPALFAIGWCITRGANMQKYTFKRWPERKFLGIFEPEVIEAGERKILCSGFWGVARHFNYMGEGFFGLSIALVWGHFGNLWAWIYFAYVVALFTYRQIDDDKRCAEKYGPGKWAEYQERVRYRIIPGIY